ncbi:putative glycosyl transferase [Paratrimastix pyriformis]|uniref:Fucosyltransferase n=1 Tax=Paratrimastix pyriformis TaxID=342808 RepID=A0ABQ8UEJ2_9EUKA|nr:putative glycosyl transferase [Paratrimastix pyriformis]
MARPSGGKLFLASLTAIYVIFTMVNFWINSPSRKECNCSPCPSDTSQHLPIPNDPRITSRGSTEIISESETEQHRAAMPSRSDHHESSGPRQPPVRKPPPVPEQPPVRQPPKQPTLPPPQAATELVEPHEIHPPRRDPPHHEEPTALSPTAPPPTRSSEQSHHGGLAVSPAEMIPLVNVPLSGPSHVTVPLRAPNPYYNQWQVAPYRPAPTPQDMATAFRALKVRIHKKIEEIVQSYRSGPATGGGEVPGVSRPVRVIVWDSFWGSAPPAEQTFEPCPLKCAYYRRGSLDPTEADAIVYHLPNFSGLLGGGRGNPSQKWVALQFEPENIHGRLLDRSLIGQMDAVATYSLMSTIPVPYWADYVFEDPTFRAPVERSSKRSDALVVFMQYACSTPTRREEYVRELMGLMPVHSYGPCLNNRQDPRSRTNAMALTREYMFSVVMENGHLPTYVTDKLYRAFQGGTIPLYRGAPDIDRYIPNHDAVIRIDDFAGPKELAAYLLEVRSPPPRLDPGLMDPLPMFMLLMGGLMAGDG